MPAAKVPSCEMPHFQGPKQRSLSRRDRSLQGMQQATRVTHSLQQPEQVSVSALPQSGDKMRQISCSIGFGLPKSGPAARTNIKPDEFCCNLRLPGTAHAIHAASSMLQGPISTCYQMIVLCM
jgi:hypothetical protein